MLTIKSSHWVVIFYYIPDTKLWLCKLSSVSHIIESIIEIDKKNYIFRMVYYGGSYQALRGVFIDIFTLPLLQLLQGGVGYNGILVPFDRGW